MSVGARDGTLIHTKGAIVRQAEREIFYVFVSAKIATFGERYFDLEAMRQLEAEGSDDE